MPALLDALRRLTPRHKRALKNWGRRLLGVDFVTVPESRSSLWPYELHTTSARRFLHFRELLLQLEDVEGQIVECGVGPGRSLFVFAILTQCVARPRRIVGFDTFEGLPEPTAEDGRGNAHKAGWLSHSEANVRELLQFNGVASDFIDENISFVRGTLAESLPAYDGRAIALLHLDVDLYESYKTALDWLWPFVSPGGIVTFDEYRSEAFPGATRAIDEFLDRWQLGAVKSRFLDRWYVVKERPESAKR
ncbi:MAG: class I SAM-dependent methyltransferase [Gammaproteobacteria bacterium]|nr:class I SAM-dependent methyltransferase [Gammaproteobacteria bacterium]